MKLERFSLSPSAPCSVPIIQTSSLPLHLNELALFAGAGGGILGGLLCGFRTVCAVEINEYARKVLLARQDDGSLEPFPVWDDICTFDGKPWRGLVDVITGGFPCQDISAAGRGAGIDGARSGLWGEMARIIGEVGPRYVLVENSPNLTSRGLGRVLGDLATLGYDARWGVLGAVHAGAPHKRERIWIVANAGGGRCGKQGQGQDEQPRRAQTVGASEALANSASEGSLPSAQAGIHCSEAGAGTWNEQSQRCCGASSNVLADANGSHEHRRRGAVQVGRKWRKGEAQDDGERRGTEWCPEPDVGRVAHGVASRVDRLTAIGNGQVPRVVALAWKLLKR